MKGKWKERLKLVELNLKAGRQARAASAFEQALEYFTLGLDLLGVAAWKRYYPLALSLHEEATEMSWLCGRFELMEKLVGAIEGGGFTPVGGLKAETSDFRIIAATNKDLKEQVKKGLMREDFFYRIHIIPIHLLPLRERKEDIPLLIEHFMQNHAPQRTCPKSPSVSWKL